MNYASAQAAKEGLGPMKPLLQSHGFRVSGRAVRCPSRTHEDRCASGWIYVARDGDERVRCFGCGFDEDIIGVATALGLEVRFRSRAQSGGRS